MVLGRVVGKAVATAKHASLVGERLLIVEPLRAASPGPVLALDQLGAGAGDLVIVSSDGKHARRMVDDINSPARWFVMGIIDDATAVESENNA